MKEVKRKCIILSAELSQYSADTNKHNSNVLEKMFINYDMPYKTLIGCYKSKNEASFLVEYNTNIERDLLLEWSKTMGQESVLLLDQDRNASLLNLQTDKENKLGKLRNISFDVAKELDAWSYCPMLDQYYGVL